MVAQYSPGATPDCVRVAYDARIRALEAAWQQVLDCSDTSSVASSLPPTRSDHIGPQSSTHDRSSSLKAAAIARKLSAAPEEGLGLDLPSARVNMNDSEECGVGCNYRNSVTKKGKKMVRLLPTPVRSPRALSIQVDLSVTLLSRKTDAAPMNAQDNVEQRAIEVSLDDGRMGTLQHTTWYCIPWEHWRKLWTRQIEAWS